MVGHATDARDICNIVRLARLIGNFMDLTTKESEAC